MATDPTLDETDASPDEGRDETGTRGTSSPPRPPRPGKRSKGSGRIPIPLPQSRPDFDSAELDTNESAPAVNIDERGEPAFPLVSPRGKPPSVPEESFADIDAELADAAPAAPVTPWRSADSSEVTPTRGTPMPFQADEEDITSQPEPTLVGKVPANLLELSSAGSDENTRAFTAPRELIELAKRKREERLQGLGEESARSTARPLVGENALDLKFPPAPKVPVDSVLPSDDEADAAPPVAHSSASELDPESRPAFAARRGAPDSGPEIEIDPASELSPSARRAVLASTGRNPPVSDPIAGSPAANGNKMTQRHWLLLFGLFFAVGIVIARWRDLAALFH